jgi:hypothetical protein
MMLIELNIGTQLLKKRHHNSLSKAGARMWRNIIRA